MKTSCLLLLAFLVAGICTQGVEGQVTGARGVGTAAGAGTGRPAGVNTGGGLFGSRTGNIMAASGYFGDQMERYGMCNFFFPNQPDMCVLSLLGGGFFN